MMTCLLAGGIFVSLSYCRTQNTDEASGIPRQATEERRNAAVLKIEETTFLNSDFEGYLQALFGHDYGELSAVSLSRVFDDFIDEKIYLHAAQRQGVSLSIEEQKEYLAKLARQSLLEQGKSPVDQKEFAAHLDRLRIEKYLGQQIADVNVADEEVTAYYNQHKREFLKPERVKVSQILLETEDKAIQVLERVKSATEETFHAVAVEESRGVEAAKGGEMGMFEMGQLPFEMEKVIFALKVGEVSQVVESAYGYHIFRLDGKYEQELVSEENAISEIRMRIMNAKIKQALQDHLAELKKQITWSSHPDNLSFEYQRKSNEEM